MLTAHSITASLSGSSAFTKLELFVLKAALTIATYARRVNKNLFFLSLNRSIILASSGC